MTIAENLPVFFWTAKLRLSLRRETEQRNQLLLANISEGGLFLASEQLKPVGTKLHFEFRVQDEEKQFPVMA